MRLLDLLNASITTKVQKYTTLQDMPYGAILIHSEKIYSRYLFMRLKPVNFLLNSTIINDVINRHDSIVCNINSGTVFCMRGDTLVHIATAEEIASVIADYKERK